MKNYFVFPLLTGLIFLFWADSGFSEDDCATILKTRCADCHYLTRVCQKVETELSSTSWFGTSAGSWKRTIKNMVYQGAKLTAEEEKKLVDCLSKPTPGIKELCDLK